MPGPIVLQPTPVVIPFSSIAPALSLIPDTILTPDPVVVSFRDREMGFSIPPKRNLCANGDFRVDTAGWQAAGVCTIARVTTQAYYQVATSAEVVTGAINGDDLRFQVLGGRPNTEYTLSVWVMCLTDQTILQVKMSDFVNHDLGSTLNTPIEAGVWTQIYVTGTTDADLDGSFYITLLLVSGVSVFLSGVQVEEGAAVSDAESFYGLTLGSVLTPDPVVVLFGGVPATVAIGRVLTPDPVQVMMQVPTVEDITIGLVLTPDPVRFNIINIAPRLHGGLRHPGGGWFGGWFD